MYKNNTCHDKAISKKLHVTHTRFPASSLENPLNGAVISDSRLSRPTACLTAALGIRPNSACTCLPISHSTLPLLTNPIERSTDVPVPCTTALSPTYPLETPPSGFPRLQLLSAPPGISLHQRTPRFYKLQPISARYPFPRLPICTTRPGSLQLPKPSLHFKAFLVATTQPMLFHFCEADGHPKAAIHALRVLRTPRCCLTRHEISQNFFTFGLVYYFLRTVVIEFNFPRLHPLPHLILAPFSHHYGRHFLRHQET